MILNSLYLMTTLKNMFCWLTWQQFRTYKKSKHLLICKSSSYFGIETNKLSRYLAVTRLDETTILRSIFTSSKIHSVRENDSTIREHTEVLKLEFKKLRSKLDEFNSSMT
ncbi:hypothetical protein Avbf_14357 [Armadillidium vulgare]|nr:hypothetical protein Avbf_14357 [Armadillidium vulgare]